MQEKLLKIIEQEDKKNPLTDEQCAKRLFLNRSEVTQLRQALGIPDSRERRKPLLEEEIKEIMKKDATISERNLTAEIKKRGFILSRYTVAKILKELKLETGKQNKEIRVEEQPKETQEKREAQEQQEEQEDQAEQQKNKINDRPDPFAIMIGWNMSLRVKVEQAKAAVLYPPYGLHTLIVGATGVGKSVMAECMYKFALKTKKLEASQFPFIIFNCADYAENPQLLLAQLFGYKKGAFTGAEKDRDGLVAKADGGILFLDEVHRLPPDGQEILFQLIDKGKYRRLGETDIVHDAQVMIIAATTEDIEKSLLATFRRRIPMIIELPPLNKRPVEERLGIIKMFFQQEAARINKQIIVGYNALRTLLIYNCVGNIGQLRSDIQVACARGFLAYVAKGSQQEVISVDFEELPVHATKDLLNTRWDRAEVEKIISEELIFIPGLAEPESELEESLYIFPNDIYKNIEEQYQELQKHGLSDEVINRIIGDELEARVKKIIKQVEKNKHKFVREDLKTIVRPEVVELVQEMVKKAKSLLGEIDDTLFYCLATHLNATVERIKSGKSITNPQLDSVKKNYNKEFKIATEMASLTSFYLGIDLPEEEIGFIAMYLRTLANKNVDPQNTIGIVVVTHGHVAEGMANVANRLLGVNHVQAVEMSLDEKPESAYQKTLDTVIKANRGKGVLILVDMGSLSSFGNFITQKTGIMTRTVTRVDTLMVIDAVRKVLLPEADIDEVATSLIRGKTVKTYPYEDVAPLTTDNMAIISLCLTGEGTARHIDKLIKNEVHKINEKIKIVTLGVLDDRDVLEQIDRIRHNMNVLAIVGTVNPEHPEIPFISSADVIKGVGLKKLLKIVRIKCDESNPLTFKEALNAVFSKDFILVGQEVRNKFEAIKILTDILVNKGCVSPSFITGVLEREEMGSTALGTSIAIPHGYGEDIIFPAVAIMTLKKPVEWYEGIKVSLVFLLALNESSKDEFKRVYKIIRNQYIAEELKKAQDAEEVLAILESI
ncbi:MAG: sigma 54-interacting transcriptional regulator [Peptococcia bacterium]